MEGKRRELEGGEVLRRQEIGIVLAGNLASEVLRRQAELVALGTLGGQFVGALGEDLESVGLVDTLALGGGDAVADPLPELRAGHLCRRGVLPMSLSATRPYLEIKVVTENSHEVVDGNTADAPNPGLHVAEANVQVLPDAVLSDPAGNVHVEQVVGGDVDVLAADEELVRGRHVLVEDLGGDGRESRVRNPSAVLV